MYAYCILNTASDLCGLGAFRLLNIILVYNLLNLNAMINIYITKMILSKVNLIIYKILIR